MKGLTALITGGGSGIGLATAKMMLEQGARVVIVGRDGGKLSDAAAKLGGGECLKTMRGDISSEGYANKLVSETLKAFGPLNILVNCAGVFRGGTIIDAQEEDFSYVVDINLKGTWLMSKYAARAMRQSGGGSIVNVSSFLGIRAAQGFPSSAYAAAKGGILALSRSLAVELAPLKIRVNTVVPAVVNTPMLASVADEQGVRKLLEQSRRTHPLGRAGEPEDVARAIVFFASPENGWITGAELPVDGGRSSI